ncbi:thioredoxin domain-containing protein [Oscillatoria sp. CS-180]|uniref:thioredoxin domain-containing protein n=1 Tax=Oscillatoria sp. CS-180 TaxID=3021720 RepID=UPI00232F33E4|nr:thioredoxin domain-containing protein [Oscillatoria sp. CS-180]MDB9527299.1 thioredoxin domain-containing protein [Oscillatoria sp. CS-180]
MTIEPLSSKNRPQQLEASRVGKFAIALVILFAIVAFSITRSVTVTQSLSPVSNLVMLRASARQALPLETAMTNGKPTLIEFYADWCTTCQAMAPALNSVHQQFDSALNRVMLNIDDPQWRHQVQQFNVTGVPHLALLRGDGAIAETFVGKVPKSILLGRLQELLGNL